MPRPKFPHFTPDEAEVLEVFMDKGPLEGKWSYDVKLESQKAKWIKFESEAMERMWKAVTAKRIDAICETQTEINIIEVKKYMMASGIGQLLVYSFMYSEQYKPTKPVKLWLIAKYPDPDVEEVARKVGIKTWTIYK